MGIFLLVPLSSLIDFKKKPLKEEFIPLSTLRKLYLEHFFKKKIQGRPSVLHKRAAVKSVVFRVTYSRSVKLRSSVLGDIGPLTVRCITSEVCNPPAGNHSSVCTSYLICMFFPSKWTLRVNIPYSLVFKWDFTAHRVQVLVSSGAGILICGQLACPRCFWMCFGLCLSLPLHPPCSTSHLLRTELVPQGFTTS